MRVLLLNQVFYPDVAATAQQSHDLARHLVSAGHEVAVITSRSVYGRVGVAYPRRETVDGIEIHRVGRSLFGKASIFARALDFGLFYLRALVKSLTVRRPDVVVCLTTPPFLAMAGWLLRLLRRSRFVYWVMDLYPDVAVADGLLKPGSLSTRLFERLNRFCLRRADRVVVVGRCMMRRVVEKGVDRGHLVHIGVWADHEEVDPLPRDRNPFRKQWHLDDRTVVMYSGNFGIAYEIETMCDAARRLDDDERLRFVFVGGGKRKAEVERYVERHHLGARIEPYQPREDLDALLSCADVHLVTLKPGFEGLTVPCKLFGIMAAARPVIFVGPPGSEIARVIEESEAGHVVEPGDVEGLVDSISTLAGDPKARASLGGNARRALVERHDRGRACERWRQLLEEVVGTGHRAAAVAGEKTGA